jgi:hypothetical protein
VAVVARRKGIRRMVEARRQERVGRVSQLGGRSEGDWM